MKNIKYCTECVQINSRPGITFDEHGVCGPCNYFKTLKYIDWSIRKEQLHKHVEWCKGNTSLHGYDCIISVSGGKDSTRQAMFAKDAGLNPLLVSTLSPPESINDLALENLDNLNKLGFDILSVEPSPIVWKKLMRSTFICEGNYGRATELALYSSAAKIALAYGIKMIFLGENNSLVYGEDIGGTDGGDASDMINYNTLGGGGVSHLIIEHEDVFDNNLFPYQYPEREALLEAGVKIVYLGYYIENFSNKDNAEFAIRHGLKTRTDSSEDTGGLHNFDALDDDFVHVNQYMKYLKFGFGKATDEVCELIRLGEMSREEGVEILKNIDGKCHQRFIDRFCKYLEIDLSTFVRVADSFRSKELWQDMDGVWDQKFKVGEMND